MIEKILNMSNLSERRREYHKIAAEGDHYHNISVLEAGVGDIIVGRDPTCAESKIHSPSDYAPCNNCLGFYLLKNLRRHVSNCSEEDRVILKFTKRGEVIDEARKLLSVGHGQALGETDLRFERYILSKLRRDVIGEMAIGDHLILRLGKLMFSKYDSSQCQWIRYTMREMARFLRQLQELSPNDLRLLGRPT